MRSYSFHEVIGQFGAASPLAKSNFTLLALPELQSLCPFLRGSLRERLAAPLILYQHLLLVLSLVVKARRCDLVLVRDFLTLPLICFVWIAWPLRKRICFINVQNLQRALTFGRHRIAFRLLCRMKFRIACLEGEDGLDRLGIDITPAQFFHLPHVVVPEPGRLAPAPLGKKRVGIVGVYRPEKGIGSLIPHLLALRERAGVEIMIGTPDVELLGRNLGALRHDIEIRDTSSGDDYAAALLSCDVVLFNYSREDYCYRGSGVITNALECGANVVCPDYPVFRRQVLHPVRVGGLFADEAAIVETALAVLHERERLFANLAAYATYRDLQAVADRIDAFVALNRPGPGKLAPRAAVTRC
jgi:glycosyltransferase involved in cell wall biosynthesis